MSMPAVANPVALYSVVEQPVEIVKPVLNLAPWLGLRGHSLQHATASRVVKGEDLIYVQALEMRSEPPSTVYLVCDGHSGVDAANFVVAHFVRILNVKLPAKVPAFHSIKDAESFADNVRRALCETFMRLDNEWAAIGHLAGTTVTAVLATGPLLTVANTGDSSAVLDTGCSILEMTKSHRIHDSAEEQARLRNSGCYLAPLGFHLQGPAKPHELGVGPMRLWPGGLCVSRSIGDLDAGPEVIPIPHIRQVLLPQDGCRLIIASDGLWDVLSLSKAVQTCRSKATALSAAALMSAVSRDLRCSDDASIIVLDIHPGDRSSSSSSEAATAAAAAARGGSGSGRHGAAFGIAAAGGGSSRRKRGGGSGGGLFASCFRPEVEELDARDTTGPGHLMYLADVDCHKAYPGIRSVLARNSLTQSGSQLQQQLAAANVNAQRRSSADFTLHGARLYQQGTPATRAVDRPFSSSVQEGDESQEDGGEGGMNGHSGGSLAAAAAAARRRHSSDSASTVTISSGIIPPVGGGGGRASGGVIAVQHGAYDVKILPVAGEDSADPSRDPTVAGGSLYANHMQWQPAEAVQPLLYSKAGKSTPVAEGLEGRQVLAVGRALSAAQAEQQPQLCQNVVHVVQARKQQWDQGEQAEQQQQAAWQMWQQQQ